jgi:hypothetical protein
MTGRKLRWYGSVVDGWSVSWSGQRLIQFMFVLYLYWLKGITLRSGTSSTKFGLKVGHQARSSRARTNDLRSWPIRSSRASFSHLRCPWLAKYQEMSCAWRGAMANAKSGVHRARRLAGYIIQNKRKWRESGEWWATVYSRQHQIDFLRKDWVNDKQSNRFFFPGICWERSFIPLGIWNVGDSNSNLIESVHCDVNREYALHTVRRFEEGTMIWCFENEDPHRELPIVFWNYFSPRTIRPTRTMALDHHTRPDIYRRMLTIISSGKVRIYCENSLVCSPTSG